MYLLGQPVGVQRYTDKPRFTLNKYRIAIHFWLKPVFIKQIARKYPLLAFEIARKSGRFQNWKR